jgi:hypothetical protein
MPRGRTGYPVGEEQGEAPAREEDQKNSGVGVAPHELGDDHAQQQDHNGTRTFHPPLPRALASVRVAAEDRPPAVKCQAAFGATVLDGEAAQGVTAPWAFVEEFVFRWLGHPASLYLCAIASEWGARPRWGGSGHRRGTRRIRGVSAPFMEPSRRQRGDRPALRRLVGEDSASRFHRSNGSPFQRASRFVDRKAR